MNIHRVVILAASLSVLGGCATPSIQLTSQLKELDSFTVSVAPLHKRNLIGLHEVRDNAILKRFLKLDPAKTAWCAGFVNALEISQGRKGTRSLMARSYLEYGSRVSLEDVRKGDIVVLWRVKKQGPYGHVGYVDKIEGDKVYIYGGNQNNMVSVQAYNLDKVLDFRRP